MRFVNTWKINLVILCLIVVVFMWHFVLVFRMINNFKPSPAILSVSINPVTNDVTLRSAYSNFLTRGTDEGLTKFFNKEKRKRFPHRYDLYTYFIPYKVKTVNFKWR